MLQQNKAALALIGLFAVLTYTVAVLTDGTGDSGDSVMHYFFSKYAYSHPENFLNHWAKPLFVFLSAPFASFGFTGMKLFNCTVALSTAWFVFRTASALGLKNSWLSVLFLFFFVEYFVLIFSGLTEPLFALLLIMAVYFSVREQYVVAALLISFLPFVRSEGWLMMGVFAFWFVIKRNYKVIPLLLAGHAVYSVIGFFHHGDLLWVFSHNPYASVRSIYGHGGWLHFVKQLYYVSGLPLYFLLSCGLIGVLFSFFKKEKHASISNAENVLVYGCFLIYFIAHTLFWKFGIFGSGGLSRVLIAVVPLGALIALRGLHFISMEEKFKNKFFPKVITAVLVLYVIAFPFMPNPAALRIREDFSLAPDQHLSDDLASVVKELYPTKKCFYEYNYLSESFGIDPFDKSLHDNMYSVENLRSVPAGSILIWDNWYAPVQAGVKLEDLQTDTLNFSEKISIKNEFARFVVFVKN